MINKEDLREGDICVFHLKYTGYNLYDQAEFEDGDNDIVRLLIKDIKEILPRPLKKGDEVEYWDYDKNHSWQCMKYKIIKIHEKQAWIKNEEINKDVIVPLKDLIRWKDK